MVIRPDLVTTDGRELGGRIVSSGTCSATKFIYKNDNNVPTNIVCRTSFIGARCENVNKMRQHGEEKINKNKDIICKIYNIFEFKLKAFVL